MTLLEYVGMALSLLWASGVGLWGWAGVASLTIKKDATFWLALYVLSLAFAFVLGWSL